MPKPTKGPRLGSGPAHERLMLANLATALFEHSRITTTETKAKRLRPFAERLITKAKRGDLHARRQVLSVIRDTSVVHHLFTEIGPSYAARPGGYTRIIKLGPRRGDNAPMAMIELVEAMPEGATTGPAAGAGAPAASEAAAAAATGDVETAESVEAAGESTEVAEATDGAEDATEEASAGEDESDEASASADAEDERTS